MIHFYQHKFVTLFMVNKNIWQIQACLTVAQILLSSANFMSEVISMIIIPKLITLSMQSLFCKVLLNWLGSSSYSTPKQDNGTKEERHPLIQMRKDNQAHTTIKMTALHSEIYIQLSLRSQQKSKVKHIRYPCHRVNTEWSFMISDCVTFDLLCTF